VSDNLYTPSPLLNGINELGKKVRRDPSEIRGGSVGPLLAISPWKALLNVNIILGLSCQEVFRRAASRRGGLRAGLRQRGRDLFVRLPRAYALG
jgi:hypothetical protein